MSWTYLVLISLLLCQAKDSNNKAPRKESISAETWEENEDPYNNKTWLKWRWESIQSYEKGLWLISNRIASLHQILVGFRRSSEGGAVYQRWGQTKCNLDSPSLYDGFVAGGRFLDSGSAAEFLCPPYKPLYWRQTFYPKSERAAALYGAVFVTRRWKNMVAWCTPCRSFATKTAIMIPGRVSCYKGMRREYFGWLMSGKYSHASATQYICVDKEYVGQLRFETHMDGRLLYHVVARCGSLKCPPFEEGRALTCVVCSK